MCFLQVSTVSHGLILTGEHQGPYTEDTHACTLHVLCGLYSLYSGTFCVNQTVCHSHRKQKGNSLKQELLGSWLPSPPSPTPLCLYSGHHSSMTTWLSKISHLMTARRQSRKRQRRLIDKAYPPRTVPQGPVSSHKPLPAFPLPLLCSHSVGPSIS